MDINPGECSPNEMFVSRPIGVKLHSASALGMLNQAIPEPFERLLISLDENTPMSLHHRRAMGGH
jgi:hypothetical protein